MGGTHISAALVNRQGKITHRAYTLSAGAKGRTVVVHRIKKIIRQVLKSSKRDPGQIMGIGLGAPGSFDFENGVAVSPTPNIPRWRGVPLKKILEKTFSLPAWVDNDVNLAALGEKYFGAGKKVRSLICFTLGTGFGGGVVINGRVHRGFFSAAGEVGHMVVKGNPLKCKCGNHGCVEMIVGAAGIVRRAVAAIKGDKKNLIMRMAKGNPEKITSKIVFDAARKGDRIAKKIVRDTAWHLGATISQAINVVDPELVVIGGAIAQAGEILLRPIRKTVWSHIYFPERKTPIVPARLGENAGIYGAAALVFQQNGFL